MPFKPGQSGNPLGRSRESHASAASIARYVAEQTGDGHELIDRLLQLSRDPKTPVRERLAATEAVISRGWGRPLQPSEIQVQIDHAHRFVTPDGFAELTERERLAMVDAWRARLLGDGR